MVVLEMTFFCIHMYLYSYENTKAQRGEVSKQTDSQRKPNQKIICRKKKAAKKQNKMYFWQLHLGSETMRDFSSFHFFKLSKYSIRSIYFLYSREKLFHIKEGKK